MTTRYPEIMEKVARSLDHGLSEKQRQQAKSTGLHTAGWSLIFPGFAPILSGAFSKGEPGTGVPTSIGAIGGSTGGAMLGRMVTGTPRGVWLGNAIGAGLGAYAGHAAFAPRHKGKK